MFVDDLFEAPLPSDWSKRDFQLGEPEDEYDSFSFDRSLRRISQKYGDTRRYLTTGSARDVYLGPEVNGVKTVIKVAKNRKGLAQNVAEYQTLSRPDLVNSEWALKFIDYDKDNDWGISWIQYPKVNWAENHLNEFLDFFHFKSISSFNNLVWAAHDVLVKKNKRAARERMAKAWREEARNGGTRETFLQGVKQIFSVARFTKSADLIILDMATTQNWGWDENHKRPIIIDAGLTREVWKNFYKAD